MSTVDLRLADLGEGLREARISEWLVERGQRVKADQPVVLVDTEKAAVEIPAPVSGFVKALLGNPGDVVVVGTLLMQFGDTADAAPPAQVSSAPLQVAGHVRAAPSTRRHAARLGVDLRELAQNGADRVMRADVDRAVAARGNGGAANGAASAPAAMVSSGEERIPLRGGRRATADAVTKSWRTIPHIAEFREIDASALVAARKQLIARGAGGLTYLPFLVMAVGAAVRTHPAFNARLDDERQEIVRRSDVHIGVAVSTEDGLLVPVVHDADRIGLTTAAETITRVVDGARAHRAPARTEPAAVTVTNFGSYGTWLGTPIVRIGESAIVGFGRIRDAVIPVDGAPAVRPVLPIAVACDHRINDGEALGLFASTIADLCGNPLALLAGR